MFNVGELARFQPTGRNVQRYPQRRKVAFTVDGPAHKWFEAKPKHVLRVQINSTNPQPNVTTFNPPTKLRIKSNEDSFICLTLRGTMKFWKPNPQTLTTEVRAKRRIRPFGRLYFNLMKYFV
ncbi:MAG: hypothetical protein ACTS43_01085 [Candidatus Hodgkinia cicadicola]